MPRSRARRAAAALLIALPVGVVGGWALSRSPDGVDVNLGEPGAYRDPTIGTNVDTTGSRFPFVELVEVGSARRVTPAPSGRAMVVNFWYSTCQPCRREMPVLAAAARKYAGRADFVGVNPVDDSDRAEKFLEERSVGFTNYLDPTGDQLARARIGTMPTTFFLDAAGYVTAIHSGELTEADLDANLAGATAGT